VASEAETAAEAEAEAEAAVVEAEAVGTAAVMRAVTEAAAAVLVEGGLCTRCPAPGCMFLGSSSGIRRSCCRGSTHQRVLEVGIHHTRLGTHLEQEGAVVAVVGQEMVSEAVAVPTVTVAQIVLQ
jgi:hypothetical protein